MKKQEGHEGLRAQLKPEGRGNFIVASSEFRVFHDFLKA
jgi:hypothetical protein